MLERGKPSFRIGGLPWRRFRGLPLPVEWNCRVHDAPAAWSRTHDTSVIQFTFRRLLAPIERGRHTAALTDAKGSAANLKADERRMVHGPMWPPLDLPGGSKAALRWIRPQFSTGGPAIALLLSE